VNKICLQCGSVLASGETVCFFCDSSEPQTYPKNSASTRGNLALDDPAEKEWRGELNHRLQAYRARRRKHSAAEGQTALPFGEDPGAPATAVAVAPCAAPAHPVGDDFAFTIAIGRPAKRPEDDETRLLIDVSVPVEPMETLPDLPADASDSVSSSLYPVASLDERRNAALIDAACLAFAYGAFLTLFGSLGGHFTFSKLSAAVCFFTFAFVYVQYFGLFTIFGGTTPGMMVRGLYVASFTGDLPTPGQFLLRACGYMLSAGTLFLGFFWATWDEDELTWHDRISRTYLAAPEVFVDAHPSHSATTS